LKIENAIHNFYVRNILGLLLLWVYGRILLYEFYPVVTNKKLICNDLFVLYIILWLIFHNQLLLTHFLLKRKTVLYAILLLFGWVAWIYVAHFLGEAGDLGYSLSVDSAHFVFYTVIGSAVHFTVKYIADKKAMLELTILKRELSLQQLKAKLNPHFLFNALNNIYSYNLENNSHGNELIMKLSQLMRYVVESSDKEVVALKEETNFINNYIEFEKERSGYRCEVGVKTTIQDQDISIAPLLFFPLIENAFKYGTSSNENSKIEIEITQFCHNLKVSISNNVIKEASKNSLNLGLENVRRRLELLYPNKHELIINNTDMFYTVNLSIDLR
jgi:two-component system, LytTR family, sensor kinase